MLGPSWIFLVCVDFLIDFFNDNLISNFMDFVKNSDFTKEKR